MSLNAKDLADFLEGNDEGEVGVDLFYSYSPDGPDNALTITDTGGWAPDPDLTRRDPTFQLLARGLDYLTAQEAAERAFLCLHQQEMVEIGTAFVHKILAMQSAPAYIGRDDKGRDQFAFNITCIAH